MNVYTMGGSIGDIIAATAMIKQKGGGELYLNKNAPADWRQSEDRLNSLKTLLEVQGYLHKVELTDTMHGVNLDHFRNNWRQGMNLADMICSWQNCHHIDRNEPWITVPETKRVNKVIIHRSPRYHTGFPWRSVVEKYGKNITFVGDHYEYCDFVQRFGLVHYYKTETYRELAAVIKGSELYIGNQSSPFWVSCAMAHPTIVEHVDRGSWAWNCHFGRDNFQGIEPGQTPNLPNLLHSSEISKCRSIVVKYCQGNGIDCGSGGDPVVPTAIQIELETPYCPLLEYEYPPQLRGDATKLTWFADESLDYVFSSHLLEDFEDWRPVLNEWLRVIKHGGYLVILIPDAERWKAALENGQPPNHNHKHEGRVGEIAEILGDKVETVIDQYVSETDYGLVYVARKV
jgi:predicted SAM-dependent methyltransferase